MKTYRLNIWRHDRLLGHFDSGTPWAAEAVKDVAGRLGAADGYRLELLVATDERRVLESGPGGVRVLGIEPLFVKTSLDEHVQG
ncbi:MAG: cytoplasmic protein [Pseudomonadota bacterium]